MNGAALLHAHVMSAAEDLAILGNQRGANGDTPLGGTGLGFLDSSNESGVLVHGDWRRVVRSKEVSESFRSSVSSGLHWVARIGLIDKKERSVAGAGSKCGGGEAKGKTLWSDWSYRYGWRLAMSTECIISRYVEARSSRTW